MVQYVADTETRKTNCQSREPETQCCNGAYLMNSSQEIGDKEGAPSQERGGIRQVVTGMFTTLLAIYYLCFKALMPIPVCITRPANGDAQLDLRFEPALKPAIC